MIDLVERCIVQRVEFLGPRAYQRRGPAAHGPLTVDDHESSTAQGLYRTASRMELRPGEVVAVWDLPADEVRDFAKVIEDLPPVPSRLLVCTADKGLLELNPEYIMINQSPDMSDEDLPQDW